MQINYSQEQKEISNRIREQLTELLSCASSAHLDAERLEMLKSTIRMLEDVFLVVVVGEFNAGKSSFINALLRTNALKEGVTPTTAQINLIRYGEAESSEAVEKWGLTVYLPVPLLQSMSFVDTPGTNTIIEGHEVLTKWFLPRADMVLFLTSSDRPFSESESKFMRSIRDWGKKVVIILNKIDLLQTEEDRQHVFDFVHENAIKLLGSDCPVLPVSARIAKQANEANSEALRLESGFSALETFIQNKMDERARFNMKMQSAIGIGSRICNETVRSLNDELSFYDEDRKLVDSVRSQVELYRGDMQKEMNRSLNEIHAIFNEVRQRGAEYFEDFFKVKNIPGMLKKDKNQIKFQENVLQNMPTLVERKTAELAEMISVQQQRMVHAVRMQVESRKSAFPGSVISDQELDERSDLLQRMQGTIDEMLVKIEADIAEDIGMKHAQSAVTAGLAIEVSAVGVGAVLTAITTTFAMDLLGIVAALWVGVAGLLVLPHYKKKSLKEFTEKITEVEDKFLSSLRESFSEQIRTDADSMTQALGPFERFVLASVDNAQKKVLHLEELRTAFEDSRRRLG